MLNSLLLDRSKPDTRRFFGSVFLFSLFLIPASLFAATLNATLDRDTVTIGEAATLTLTFEGGTPKLQPTVPSMTGLRTQFGGQNSQFTWINGESKSSVTYTYSLAPTQPGDFNIPPIEAKVGNETLRTPPLLLKAMRAEAATPEASNADQQLALVKLVTPNRPIYVGEVVPIELQLYVRDGVLNIQNFQSSPMNAEGFTFGKTIQAQRRVVRVGNANFLLIPFITSATAVKTGNLAINPVDCTMGLELPTQSQGQRQRDPFDPFGMFNHNERRQVTISTEAASVQVLSLPEGAPAEFNGAVGSYSLNMTAAPTNVAAGDPVTVKIQIAGRGAIDTLTLPPQAEWNDFKMYPPTSKVETSDQLGLQGHKDFELVVVPQSPEVRELPPLSFSYFDPEHKAYRTLKQPGVKLTVRPSVGNSNNTLAAANPNSVQPEKPVRDIVPIKQRLGSVGAPRPALMQRPGFWLVQTIPVAAWLTLLVRRRKADALANNPRLRRQQAVATTVASGLQDLQQFAAAKDSDEFFATLFHLLQEQLGERLDMPASSITESVVDEYLQPRDVATATLERLRDLFQACNQARYAPVKSTQELEAFIPRLETTLREIQSMKS